MKPITEYQRKDANGVIRYIDEEGCEYDNLGDLLQIYALGLCGCGNPEAVLKMIYDLLQLKEQRREDCDWDVYYSAYTAYLIANIDSVKWFIDYFLDKQAITTHGGNVSGGWVDDDNFKEALNIWHNEYIQEQSNETV